VAEAGKCPECGSGRLYRDGLRYTGQGPVQRFLCRGCGYRFSDPDKPYKECQASSNRQLCAILQEAKKLSTTAETKTAGETEKTQQGTILDYAWKLKKRGLSEYTIKNRTSKLGKLQQLGADLLNPDSVETIFATETWTPSNKQMAVSAYANFAKTLGITWTPIKVRYQPRQPFIPTEGELDQLIAGCGKRTGTFLQTLKDTGARAGEVCNLKWIDMNDQNNTISINNAEKGSNNRTVKVSPKTIAMVKALPKKYGDHIFNPRLARTMLGNFIQQRTRIAEKLQNPRIRQIHFHTFRHWKATMEYHRTRDILHVKHMLGHKRLENTEIYTHLIEFENNDYHVAHAKTLEEEDKLIESGFEFVRHDQCNQIAIYRKRK